MSEKKLGYGLMRLPQTDPNDPTAIDMEATASLVDAFMERGGDYFDTAWMYCGHNSENVLRRAVTERYPRERFRVATKLHSGFLQTKEDRDRIFYEQLKKTGLTYFDYYLLHGIEEGSYPKYTQLDCFSWLKEKKEQGLVRKIGFSFHASAEVLEQILTEHPEMEFVQLQLNYLDWESEDVQSRRCYEVARRHNLPIIVMEPVKGGTLASVPPVVESLFRAAHPDWSVASWAMRFVSQLPGVMMVLSGMSEMQQVLDNAASVDDPTLLTEEDHAILRRAVAILNSQESIPCTGCAYCVEGCPMQIPIPRCFSLYNEERQEERQEERADKAAIAAEYRSAVAGHGKASACIGCGQCEAVCPQHLPIPALLRQVADCFEK